MATIVGAAGGGNWSAGGTWVGGVPPTAADDVVLASTSGNVTIDANANCRSLDCMASGNYAGTLSHVANVTLNIGDGTAGVGNVALRFSAGMTYSPTLAGVQSTINFAQSPTGTPQTVNTQGKAVGNMTFGGSASGNWQFAANFLHTGAGSVFGVSRGTVDLNGKTFTISNFSSSNANARTITLGAAAITVYGVGTAWDFSTATNLTFNANTSTITFTGAGPTLASGGKAFNSVVFSGTGTPSITQTNSTYANLTRTAAAATDGFQLNDLAVTGTLTLTGLDAAHRLFVSSNVLGTAKTITAAAVSLNNVTFQDTAGAGAAAPFTGTIIGNALGNSGITFTASVTQAYAGGVKNWDDPTAWTSRVPLPQDDVTFAGVGGTISTTANSPRLGRSLDFTGFTGTLNLTAATTTLMFGSLTLGAGMTVSNNNTTLTLAGRGSHTITSNGKAWGGPVIYGQFGGTWTLQDDLNAGAGSTQHSMGPGGTLDANNHNVSVPFFVMSQATATINMGSGTWTVARPDAGFPWQVTAGTVNAGTSNIVLPTSTTARIFDGGGKVYYDLTYTVAGSTGKLTINGNNQWHTIHFKDATNARTLSLAAGSTQVITGPWDIAGTAGKLMTVNSATPGTPATLSMAATSPTPIMDYISFQDITATGGSVWMAGSHSVNVSGNTGLVFGDAVMGAAAMVSASTMSAAGVPEVLGAAALTSQSSLSAAGVPEVPAAASLTSTSTMFATGSVKAAPRLKHPTAILTGHAAGHRVTIPVPRGNTGTTTPAYG